MQGCASGSKPQGVQAAARVCKLAFLARVHAGWLPLMPDAEQAQSSITAREAREESLDELSSLSKDLFAGQQKRPPMHSSALRGVGTSKREGSAKALGGRTDGDGQWSQRRDSESKGERFSSKLFSNSHRHSAVTSQLETNLHDAGNLSASEGARKGRPNAPPPFVFLPHYKFLLVWDSLALLLLFFTAVYTPFELAFLDESCGAARGASIPHELWAVSPAGESKRRPCHHPGPCHWPGTARGRALSPSPSPSPSHSHSHSHSLSRRRRWVALEFVVDFFFLFDLAVSARTAYFSDVGELVTEPRAVARHYLCSSSFVIDLVASLPYNWFFPQSNRRERFATQRSDEWWLRFGLLLRLLKMSKMLRLVRLNRASRYVSRGERNMYSFGGLVNERSADLLGREGAPAEPRTSPRGAPEMGPE